MNLSRPSPKLLKRPHLVGQARRGSALILTLIAVLLLSFSAYTFAELMRVESHAAAAAQRFRTCRLAAESGIEALAAELEQGLPDSGRDGPKKQPWQRVPLSTTQPGLGAFSIASDPFQPSGSFSSLVNESSKLNLKTLPRHPSQRELARSQLMALPGMDRFIADAILDWIDEDDQPSDFGAESTWYASQKGATLPRQKPLESLEELLLVRGVTRELLYGEDTNQNGRLDPEEDDGDMSPPMDNRDGRLDRGWSDLITVTSWESTLRRNNTPKINLNQQSLVALFDELEKEFDIGTARFIVAWRLNGDIEGVESQRSTETAASNRQATENKLEAARRRAALQQTQVPTETGDQEAAEVRGGISLNRRPPYRVRSVWDLLGSTVRIDVEGKDTVLKSPWTLNTDRLDGLIADLEARFTTSDEERIEGRIRISQAARPVLLAVPGLRPETVDQILKVRNSRRVDQRYRSVAWLLIEKVLDLESLRQVAPSITAGGAVYSGVSWGLDENHRIAVGIRFLLDRSQNPVELLKLEDLDSVASVTTENARQTRSGN